MSRFETIQKGKRARKTVDFPAPIDAEKPEERIKVDLIVLAGDEESEAIEAAREFATKRGVVDPKQGDPQYDLGLMAHTLVRACLDPDEPGSFAFFFKLQVCECGHESDAHAHDGEEKCGGCSCSRFVAKPQNRGERPSKADFAKMVVTLLGGMDREAIHYLHQLQMVWQDHCSPWGKADDEETILKKLEELEGVVDPARPFEMFRPATVGSLLLTTVKQRATLLRARSLAGTSSGFDSPKSASSAAGEA